MIDAVARDRRLIDVSLLALGLCIVIGTWLRLANLGGKVCFLDESATALRVGGHTIGDFQSFFETAGDVAPAELRRFQRIVPERGLGATVVSLLREEPQHPPVFYALERWWAGIAGDSLARLRLGAALLSLLALPGLFWLGRELRTDDSTTRAAVMLWSLSPFFVTYAQEAREYGLWSSVTILSSAAFLHATRTNRGWWCYAALTTVGLYTSMLFAAVPAAHTAWLTLDQQARSRWRGLVAALTVAVICFSPWLVAGAENRATALDETAWMRVPRSLPGLMRSWMFGVTAVVFDVRGPGMMDRVFKAIGCGVALTVLAGGLAWWRSPERRGMMFAALLIAANAVPLATADLLCGGCRSTVPRFLVAAWVGELLLLAWIGSRHRWLLATFLALGLTAGLIRLPARTWWDIYSGPDHMALADRVNAESAPLLLAAPRGDHYNLLTLSHFLGDHVRVAGRGTQHDAARFSRVFVLIRPERSAASPVPPEACLVLDTGVGQLWRLPHADEIRSGIRDEARRQHDGR
jgi:uncharacterized membrane protein